MPWKPEYPGEVPTLGWYVLEWIEEELAAPDRPDYEPLVLTREQARFVLNYYALDPKTGKRRYRRGVLSRPKGWGKSPILGGLAVVEALADVVPDGWDADGRPVGRPWSDLRTPLAQIAAVSEDQTANAWDPLLEMIRQGPVLDDYHGLEALDTFVNLPGAGRIEPVTASAVSREGNRPIFAVLDQTESWKPSNHGVKLAATIRRNLGKTGGTSIESPNAFEPGAGSVAEASAEYATRIAEGRARDEGLLYDHREWPPDTDMTDRASLLDGLAVAYGDSAIGAGGWVDLERLVGEIWDPATDPQDARRYYGNQVTHASDAWLTQPEWAAVKDPTKTIDRRDPIVLGFDGSRQRSQAVTDATALIACRVSDAHLFEPLERCVWEQPEGPEGESWQVPTTEVDAAVGECFARYNVVGFFADPAKWEGYVAEWEAKYGKRLKVQASRGHPIEWWMTGGRTGLIVRALEQFHGAVVDGELSHSGSFALTRHILNARRRIGRSGVQIAKEHPESPRKIDAAIAAVLAYQARLAAVGQGIGSRRTSGIPRKVR
jgi:hypothetical protein